MQGRRTTGWLRALPVLLLAFAVIGAVFAPAAARAEEPTATLEVSEPKQADGALQLTLVAPASLAGAPKVSVDGSPRNADVAITRRPAVVLAVETSSSMGFGQLDGVRNAAAAFLRQLPPTTKVAVVTFDNAVRTSGFGDASAAQAALENLTPTGGSALFDGVTAAATALRDAERASASLVVVTHGWDWGGASASNRADSFGAAQALGGEIYPVIVGSDFDRSLLSAFANPARTTGWTLEDLGSGTLAGAVARGARVEQSVKVPTAGLKAGDHQLAINWDGATAVTRSFPVVAEAPKSATAAAGEAVATALNLNGSESGKTGVLTIATVLMFALMVVAYLMIRRDRARAAAAMGGRLDRLEDAPVEAEAVELDIVSDNVVESSAPDVEPIVTPVHVQPVLAHDVPRHDSADQRAFERVQLGVAAELTIAGVEDAQSLSVLAYDISEGGLSFRVRSAIPAGAAAYLNMALPPNGDEVELHVMILNVVPLGDGEMFSAHCSFIDITPRTLWRIVGACLALSGDTANAEELMGWGVKHAVSADLPEGDALFERAPGAVASFASSDAISSALPLAETEAIGEAFEDHSSFVDEFAASVAAEAIVTAPAESAGEAFGDFDAFDSAPRSEVEVFEASAFEPDVHEFAGLAAEDAFSDDVPVVAVVEDESAVAGSEYDSFEDLEPFESVAVVEDELVDVPEFSEPIASSEPSHEDEFETYAWFDRPAMADDFDVTRTDEEAEADAGRVPVADGRALNAAMQLAWLLGDAAASGSNDEVEAVVHDDAPSVVAIDTEDTSNFDVASEIDGADEDIEVVAAAEQVSPLVAVRSDAMSTRFDAPVTADEVRCSHCAGGVLELQRLVRQDDFLESWWLCMACTRITYRQQEPEAWLRTTSVPDGSEFPGPSGPSTDFAAVLLRMRQEEAAATARAAQLRDELARAEGVLHDIRTLHRLLDRFGGEAEQGSETTSTPRPIGKSPAA